MLKPVVIIPNWNGKDHLASCLDSLLAQSLVAHIIVVDNGSIDGSVELIKKHYGSVELIRNAENKGYAGGVNPGFRAAIELGARYAAPFNNDAVADKHWLKHLVEHLEEHPEAGIAACKLLNATGTELDSSGDYYTSWGLPYPRGRGETDIDAYDEQTELFAASGGASLYRVQMLEEIGLFDEDFFAYYEDVDLSFRAQLAGYKVHYVPQSKTYHQIGATSGSMKGFTTYQTMKNLPLLLYKNVPSKYLYRVGMRLTLARSFFLARAITRHFGWKAISGDVRASILLKKKRSERKRIQSNKKVSDEYIWSIMTHDLPPNARALRLLRAKWWKLAGKS